MIIQHAQSLKPFNTLALPAIADKFIQCHQLDELQSALKSTTEVPLILGGGSNVIFRRQQIPFVIQILMQGIEKIHVNDDEEIWRVSAGESWHHLVEESVKAGLSGLENLAGIPGSVGAAPMQNIGAYGVEIKDSLVGVHAIHRTVPSQSFFNLAQCQLSYRNSFFKSLVNNPWIITHVDFRLRKTFQPKLSYGELAHWASNVNPALLSPRLVMQQVLRIRTQKLPDPKTTPNAGSFFHNPVVTLDKYWEMKKDTPDLVAYEHGPGHMKLAAGYLLQALGWKGRRVGHFQVHPEHALVITHLGGGDGEELLAFAALMQQDLSARWGLTLQIEPKIFA